MSRVVPGMAVTIAASRWAKRRYDCVFYANADDDTYRENLTDYSFRRLVGRIWRDAPPSELFRPVAGHSGDFVLCEGRFLPELGLGAD